MSVSVCIGDRVVKLPTNDTLKELIEDDKSDSPIVIPFDVPPEVVDLLETNDLTHATREQAVALASIADYLQHEPAMAAVTQYFKQRSNFKHSEFCCDYWHSDVQVPHELVKFTAGYVDNIIRTSTEPERCLLSNPGGWIFISSGAIVIVVNAMSGECAAPLIGHTSLVWCAVEVGVGQVASGSMDATVRMWNWRSGTCTAVLRGHTRSILSLLHLSGDRLASGSRDNTVRVWELSTSACNLVITLPDFEACFRMLELTNNTLVVVTTTSTTHISSIWSLSTGIMVKDPGFYDIRGEGELCCIGGRNLLVISPYSDSCRINVIDLLTAEVVAVLLGHSKRITTMSTLVDSRLASCSNDKTIRVWDILSSQCVSVLSEFGSIPCSPVALVSKNLIAMRFFTSIDIWDLESGKLIETKSVSVNSIDWFKVMGDGLIVYKTYDSGSLSGSTHVWNLYVAKADRLRVLTAAGAPNWCIHRILTQ